MKRKNWTRKELILAINLYCKTPFGRIHSRNPDIIKLSQFLGRTPGAIAWKMCNFASESILAGFDMKGAVAQKDSHSIPDGREIERSVKVRVNQHFFRQAVLSSYDFKCCITNISIPELLISSHIIPWAEDAKNRLNPRNGLCLNALHDKAFDQGLLTISTDFKVMISPIVKKYYLSSAERKFILDYSGKEISLPRRFIPNTKFLEYHQKYIFKQIDQ